MKNDSRIVHAIWNEVHPDDLMPQRGYLIHHKDENHSNNAIDNLEKLRREKHQSIHTKGKSKSIEMRKKVSERMRFISPTSRPEVQKKLRQNHADVSGERHPFFGKHHTEATKEKMSIAKKGKPWSEARRLAARKGEK